MRVVKLQNKNLLYLLSAEDTFETDVTGKILGFT